MNDPKGIITEIQRCSFEDGPGIRTTVFFKGCPLRCRWCHNPESIAPQTQLLQYPEKCIGCGRCAEGCYAGAKVLCGKEMTAVEILAEIAADAPYFGEKGGVTFTGGEPLLQPELLSFLLDRCKEQGIHTAIETSMIFDRPEVLQKCDLIIADIKIFDSRRHQEFTGVPNEGILENIRRADTLGIPLAIHTPVIPGVNADAESITAIRQFIGTLKNVTEYRLLPYHPLGLAKQKALGEEPTPFEMPSPALMKELNRYADLS